MVCRYLLLVGIVFAESAIADYDQLRNSACPDGWQMHQQAVPDLNSANLNPWGVNTSDRAIALSFFGSSVSDDSPTVDAQPASAAAKVDDLLTVASECLLYRSHIVKGDTYMPPVPPVEYNPSMGWIPATF